MLKKRTVLAAVHENPAYTLVDPIPATGANYNIFDIATTPTIEGEDREAGDGFSNLYTSIGKQSGQVSFKTDVYGAVSYTHLTLPTKA